MYTKKSATKLIFFNSEFLKNINRHALQRKPYHYCVATGENNVFFMIGALRVRECDCNFLID
jgi:hypothetical protein